MYSSEVNLFVSLRSRKKHRGNRDRRKTKSQKHPNGDAYKTSKARINK